MLARNGGRLVCFRRVGMAIYCLHQCEITLRGRLPVIPVLRPPPHTVMETSCEKRSWFLGISAIHSQIELVAKVEKLD